MYEGLNNLYGAFLGYELCLFLFPYAEKNKKWLKYIHLGNGITMFLYLLVSIMAYGFFSHRALVHSSFPILDMYAYLRFPFIERIQNFLFSLFLFSIVQTAGMYYWAGQEALAQVFPQIPWKVIVFVSMVATIPVGMIPKTLIVVESWSSYFTFVQIGVAFGLPLLLILLLLMQRRLKKHA